VLENFGPKFQGEHTYTLIIRLRHNVIKTGVRMINLSYSRISLSSIANKLTLDSPEDAEYIVAKVSTILKSYWGMKPVLLYQDLLVWTLVVAQACTWYIPEGFQSSAPAGRHWLVPNTTQQKSHHSAYKVLNPTIK
jgi:hypothetical protein